MSHIRASPLLPIAANHLCQRHQGDRLDRVQPSLAQTLALPSPSPLPAEKAAASHHRRCLYCYHTTATTQPLSTVASHLLCPTATSPLGRVYILALYSSTHPDCAIAIVPNNAAATTILGDRPFFLCFFLCHYLHLIAAVINNNRSSPSPLSHHRPLPSFVSPSPFPSDRFLATAVTTAASARLLCNLQLLLTVHPLEITLPATVAIKLPPSDPQQQFLPTHHCFQPRQQPPQRW
ncbi:hypothetical protein BHM03_00035782 [Ensete ventricosum]|nr:hypothetical protein BHM03_00035782 [Ensete ventricosum]